MKIGVRFSRKCLLLGVLTVLVTYLLPAARAAAVGGSTYMEGAGSQSVSLLIKDHQRVMQDLDQQWAHPRPFGRKRRNEILQSSEQGKTQALADYYVAMGQQAEVDLRKVQRLCQDTARVKDGVNRVGAGASIEQVQQSIVSNPLAVLHDFDRWLVLHFTILVDDAALAAKHRDAVLAGCDFVSPDLNGKDIDWLNLREFYRGTIAPAVLGEIKSPTGATGVQEYPSLLPKLNAFVERVAHNLEANTSARFVSSVRETLQHQYDCCYLNFALNEWSKANGDKQLAFLMQNYHKWATEHAYSPARYLDGFLDSVRPQYFGSFWYRGGPLDRCDKRVLTWAQQLKGRNAYDRAVEAHAMFRELQRKGVLVGGGGGGTIQQCLDIGKAGCGLGSAILGSTLGASGVPGVFAVGLRGEDSGHGIIAVQTERGLLFLDRATSTCALSPEYLEIRKAEARKQDQYKTYVVFDRSFASQSRAMLCIVEPRQSKSVVYDRRAPYYRCERDGRIRGISTPQAP